MKGTTQRLLFYLLALAIGLSACEQSGSETTQSRLPNVIYILADDMGYGDLGCFGQKTLKTPNIDLMAKEGMIFTQHYAGATVCAPSRSALFTGQHTGHTAVRGNKPDGMGLPPESTTLAEVFKNAGYATAMFGKWGIGHPPPPDDPNRHGFDYSLGYINMWHAHNCFPEFLYENGKKKFYPGNKLPDPNPWANMPEGTGVSTKKTTFAPDEFRQGSLEFIESHKEEPFFLYLALNIPHANNEGKNDGMEVPNFGKFQNESWPKPEKGFARMMEMIDQTVGDVMDKVKELGLDENTLIIFTSDNGPHQEGGHKCDFFDSNGPLRGAKRDLYEGGVRVPMIARWPGNIQTGSNSEHISAFWDVLPTMCELTNQPKPGNIDGISFLPSLLSKEQKEQHPYLYWEFYELGARQAVRKGKWKLVKLNVRENANPVVELYDLTSDLAETNNIAEQHPSVVEELSNIMKEAHTPHPLVSLFENTANTETPF